MDRQPPVPSNALTEWTRHPVPVDVGQICHLADIEERAATRDLELIGEPSWIAAGFRRPTNTKPHTALAKHLALAARVLEERVPAARPCRLRAPRFKVTSPSVVVCRGPQRDEPPVTS